jgi:hypothetical protein
VCVREDDPDRETVWVFEFEVVGETDTEALIDRVFEIDVVRVTDVEEVAVPDAVLVRETEFVCVGVSVRDIESVCEVVKECDSEVVLEGVGEEVDVRVTVRDAEILRVADNDVVTVAVAVHDGDGE